MLDRITNILGFIRHIKGSGLMAVLLLLAIMSADFATASAIQIIQSNQSQLEQQFVLNQKMTENQQQVSLELDEVSLVSALRMLAEKVEVGFSFQEYAIPNKKVTASFDNVPVYEVLYSLLEETNLEMALSPDRETLIIRQKVRQNLNIQEETVTGTVTDAQSGETLPGVNVMVKGTTTGTSTDSEGHYELAVPSLQDTLIFSFVGYQTREVPINGRTSVDVALQSEAIAGEEVVVVGYGAQRSEDVTGSVGQVKMPSVEDQPISGANEALAGQIAGVQVSSSNGIPGGGPKINIRGVGAIGAGSNPLYVVDGFPLPSADEGAAQTSNPLNNIPSSDIASITVLKDASATAIYGSRGANGVVLIETKTGSRSNELQFHVDAYNGIQTIPDFEKPDLMNAEQFARFMKERIQDQNALTGENREIPEIYQNPEELAGEGTDWYDTVTQVAPTRNINFSLSSGNENITSYVSGGYFSQQGVVKGTSYDRYSFRANVNADISPKLEMGFRIAPIYSEGTNSVTGGEGRYEDAFGYALVASPIPSVYNEDGSYNVMIQSPGTFNYGNPLMIIDRSTHENSHAKIIGSGFIQYDITDNLSLKSTFNIDWSNRNQRDYRPSTLGGYNVEPPTVASGSYMQNKYLNWANENILTYQQTFAEEHTVDFTAGLTEQRQINNSADFDGTQFPDNEVTTLNAASTITGGTNIESWALASYFGRLNYTYNDKYLLTGTVRRDGSSRFGPDNRWGTFPSVAVGWAITNEPWMEPHSSWLSNLKLRASYGLTGNDQIGNFTYLGQVGLNNYVLGEGNLASGKTVNTLGNSTLGWQQMEEVNLGLDVGLFNDRLTLEANAYRRRTSDLLLNLEVPQSSGFATALENIGEVQNQGLEFTVNSQNILTRDFTWSTNVNFSLNRNKTLSLGPDNEPIFAGYSGEGHYTNITEVGEPVGMFYGYKFEGLYQSEQDIENSPSFPGAIPGNMKVADINGDGVITPESDFTTIGNPYPKFTYGLTNNLTYKNFDLRFVLTGSYGAERLKTSYEYFHNIDGVFNVTTDVINRWHSQEEPGNGRVPTTAGSSFARVMYRDVSSLWVYDASYLWVKNITLGYDIPHRVISGFLSNVRLYGSIQNAYVFTPYPGNPAVSHYGTGGHDIAPGALTPGLDFTGYPVPRVFTIGIKIDY